MQLFGLGKKPTENTEQTDDVVKKKSNKDIKNQVRLFLKLAARYETTIIALAVAIILTATSMRMFRYMDPPIDDNRVQEILAKNKRVRIDPKIVQKIKQLQDSGALTPTKVESNRTNPFTE